MVIFIIEIYLLASFCIEGKTRARDAALNAIQSPLLDIGIERATGIVWNITGGSDLTLFEVAGYPSGLKALSLFLF
jgi:cell division GTPase FtsZ